MSNTLKNSRKIFTGEALAQSLVPTITTLSNNEYKITYYEVVSGTSGTLTVPTNATINSGEFAGNNSIISEVDGSNKPTYISPKTAGGTVITSTLNVGTAAWTISGTPTVATFALIYSIKIKAIYYSNLTYSRIIESDELDGNKVYTTPLLYTSSTDTVSILQSSAGQSGYLSNTDWSTFNGKQAALSGTGIVKSTAGTISYITGTSAQFVKADGSLDSTVYGTGTVTSVSGTTNRITSTGGATPVIDISVTFEALLGKVANPLSQFAATTSAQLAGVISDETGSGALVFGTSPTFTTQIITPILYGSSASSGTLIIDSTTNATKGAITFGTAGTNNIYNFNVGTSTSLVTIRERIGSTTQGAIYLGVASGSETASNYMLGWDGSLRINAQSTTSVLGLKCGDTAMFTITPTSTVSTPFFMFNVRARTGLTTTTNIPAFDIVGQNSTWAAGTVPLQYFNYLRANQMIFASASTATYVSSLTVEGTTVGSNATFGTGTSLYLPTKAYTATTTGLGVDVEIPTGATISYGVRINGGTTTSAPLKLTSGTNMTTAVSGAIEYNGNFYLSNATTRFSVGGKLPFTNFADVSVGGAETDIYSATLLANTFNVNGDSLFSMYGGNFVTVGTELTQLKVYLAGTAIWDSTALAPATGTTSWRVLVELIRVSSTVIRYTVSLNTTGATGYVYCTSGELTGLTLSNTNILKITGTSSGVGSGAGDIVGKMSYMRIDPAS